MNLKVSVVYLFSFLLIGCGPSLTEEEKLAQSKKEYEKNLYIFNLSQKREDKNFLIQFVNNKGELKNLGFSDSRNTDTPISGWVGVEDGETLKMLLTNKRDNPVAFSFSKSKEAPGSVWYALNKNEKHELEVSTRGFLYLFKIDLKEKSDESLENKNLNKIDFKWVKKENEILSEKYSLYKSDIDKAVVFSRKIVEKGDLVPVLKKEDVPKINVF